MVDGSLRFVDPHSWILKRYPTVLACSPVMPVRWEIQGDWFCSTPEITRCQSGHDIDSPLNWTTPSDFTRGLGRGIFSEKQLQQHGQYWRAANSRSAVAAQAANVVLQTSKDGGTFGGFFSASDIGGITDTVMNHLFHWVPMFGTVLHWGFMIYVMFAVMSNIFTVFSRAWAIHERKGCALSLIHI